MSLTVTVVNYARVFEFFDRRFGVSKLLGDLASVLTDER